MNKKIVLPVACILLIMGMFSGCVEEEIESNNAPVADFEWSPETISANKTVEFTSTSTDADDDDLTYTWDFGDGTALSSKENPTHIYNVSGFYNVTLEVNDGTANNTKTQMINVGIEISSNEAPTADFIYKAKNLTVRFDDNSTDNDGDIAAWEWDFDGNGVIDNTTQSPIYTYAEAGTYNVTLTVTDDDATDPKTDTVTKEVTVTTEE